MERLDPLLTLAWVRAGGRYLLAENGARSAAPELLTVERQPFVLLPRVSDDDAIAMRRAGVRPDVGGDTLSSILDREYRAALAKLRALGGLSITRWHATTAGGTTSRLIAGIARRAAADSTIWIAPAADVADWWLRRSRLALTTVAAGDSVTVSIANDGTASVDGAVVRVVPPAGFDAASIDSASIDGARRLAAGGDYLALLLPRLAPGSVHTVTLHARSQVRRAR